MYVYMCVCVCTCVCVCVCVCGCVHVCVCVYCLSWFVCAQAKTEDLETYLYSKSCSNKTNFYCSDHFFCKWKTSWDGATVILSINVTMVDFPPLIARISKTLQTVMVGSACTERWTDSGGGLECHLTPTTGPWDTPSREQSSDCVPYTDKNNVLLLIHVTRRTLLCALRNPQPRSGKIYILLHLKISSLDHTLPCRVIT